ncbi:peptidase M15A [Ectothiorhodospiraceae bacterium WFHF3C12]|nr:peptidase M15A [Ectothiorhodospiraceae bacterium WFHF3C12]
MATQLSRNFSLEELCKSQTAERRGIDNSLDPARDAQIVANLRRVCEEILQPTRDHFDVPIVPSSGYRCLELNRAIGSKDTSQHVNGEAVDFEVPGIANADLAAWIESNLDYDQLILEFYMPGQPNSGWVHCSITGGENRHVALTINRDGVTEGLLA